MAEERSTIDRRGLLAAGGIALGAAAAAAPASAAAPVDTAYPEPRLTFAFQANVALGPVQELGMVDGIRRRIVPIVGGTIDGPRFRGTVIPGGADWQGIRPSDGLTRVFAHYWIRAEDGQVISVQNSGIRRAAPAVMKRLMTGERVPPSDYYFRATPSFEVGSGPHAWLNENLFVCVGARLPDAAIVRVYLVE